MKLPPNICFAPAAIAIAVAFSSCGDKESSADVSGDKTSASTTLEAYVAASAPEGALTVVEAKGKAEPGAEITLRGKVGGKMKPISESLAVLVLADEKAITSCDDIPGDGCKTPWDYCCEESAAIAASTATIQIRDDDGKLVRSSLRGLGGLKELSLLVVSGTVDAASGDQVLIVNAAKVHVEKP